MYTEYNIVDVSRESSVKDVFITCVPCSCFGAVPFCLDKHCENVKCTLTFKGRLEALRFALYAKFPEIQRLLFSALFLPLPGVQRSPHRRAEHESETLPE